MSLLDILEKLYNAYERLCESRIERDLGIVCWPWLWPFDNPGDEPDYPDSVLDFDAHDRWTEWRVGAGSDQFPVTDLTHTSESDSN